MWKCTATALVEAVVGEVEGGRTRCAGMRVGRWTRCDVDLLLFLRIERLSTGVHFGSRFVPTRIGGSDGAREVVVSRGRGDHSWKL